MANTIICPGDCMHVFWLHTLNLAILKRFVSPRKFYYTGSKICSCLPLVSDTVVGGIRVSRLSICCVVLSASKSSVGENTVMLLLARRLSLQALTIINTLNKWKMLSSGDWQHKCLCAWSSGCRVPSILCYVIYCFNKLEFVHLAPKTQSCNRLAWLWILYPNVKLVTVLNKPEIFNCEYQSL